MDAAFSIVVPTVGRPSLRRTLMSIKHADFEPELDQLVVVGDGYQPEARRMVEQLAGWIGFQRWVYKETPFRKGSGSARHLAFEASTGTHITLMDDDDQYTPHALRIMRRCVEVDPARPHIFQMRNCNHDRAHWHRLWASRDVKAGNIGTPMVVFPNQPEKFGVWDDNQCADFRFFNATFCNFANSPMWHEHIIVDVY